MNAEWWHRFVASDPAMRRLRTATRAVLSLATTLAIMLPLLIAWGQRPTSVLLGAVVSVLTSTAVNDDTIPQRKVTTLLMPLPASLSLVLSTASGPVPVLNILIFLLVIFVATYVRRFGPRYFALGFIGFMGYFFATFLRPTVDQLPEMLLTIVCGALVAFVMRFVVLREEPHAILERGQRSLRSQVHALMQAVRELAEHPWSEGRRRQLDKRATRFNETALMLESNVEQLSGLDAAERERLRQHILDIELAAENLLTPLLRMVNHPSGGGAAPPELGDLLKLVHLDPSRSRQTSRAVAERIEQRGSAETALEVRRLGSALAELANAIETLGSRAHRGTAEDGANRPEDEAGEEKDEGEEAEETGLRRPEVRTAVQVTCAAGLAVVFGQLISPNRWYWAVITAFVVFISTNSRGELLVRAWQRTVGTMLGVVAGILVAVQVTGNPVVELTLILACVFLAFYFIGYSYSLLTFFITTMLGILYGILGIFTISVLGLRLAETAVGAAAGILAALLVLPTRTSTLVRSNTQDFLLSLRDLLRQWGNDISGRATLVGVQEGVRELDDRLNQLVRSARPLTNYRFRSRRTQLDRSLTLVSGCAYYTRNLSTVLPAAVDMVDDDTRNRLAEMLWELADTAGALTDEASQGFGEARDAARRESEALHDIAEALPSGPSSLHRSLNLLDRVSQTLTDLAGELGADPGQRAAPGA